MNIVYLRSIVVIALLCVLVTQVFAAVFDLTPRDVLDVRVYPDGSFVMHFAPPVSANCGANDHTVTPPTAPAYKLISSLALVAYTSGRKVLLIYNGCGSPVQNVNLTGLTLPQQ